MTDLSTAGPIALRVQRIEAGQDSELLYELPSGYAILGKYQPDPINGCCMLLPKHVVSSPNELKEQERAQFFSDLVLIGDAIMEVTGSTRINYLVLCNQVPELHGHCVPRFDTEDPMKRKQGPFEAYDFGAARVSDANGEDHHLHSQLCEALKKLHDARNA